MATFKIDTPSARAKLATRTSPYWHKVQTNRFVGFRYMTQGSEGTWIAKLQRQGGEERFAMGKLDEVAPAERFGHALKLAAKWFAELETTGHAVSTVVPYKMTLMQALEAYTLEQGKKTRDGKPNFGEATMREVKRRFEAIVTPWPSPEESWVDRPLSRIKAADFVKWREWLEGRTNCGRGEQAGASLTVETINRYLVPVVAALNLASELHGIPNVWKKALAKTKVEDHGRGEEVYLDADQRAAFLKGLETCGDANALALVPLAKAMTIAPIRPGALALMQAKHYEVAQHQLHVWADKAGAGRRVRLPKTEPSLSLLKTARASKLPTAPLFADAQGREWNADRWNKAAKKGAAAAGLPSEFTLYWLRHSRITDLVNAGQSANAIAKMAGTSVAMIEKHYFKWTAEAERLALAA